MFCLLSCMRKVYRKGFEFVWNAEFVFQFAMQNMKIKLYMTIILPLILYGCETWLLTLREECRLRVLENRVLRRIFGPKRDETTGEWGKLHNEELNDLYSSPSIVQVIKSRRIQHFSIVGIVG